ncbi:MAG: OmpH family outer membrane protein [Verrucomicrobia bacterium]|nr:OmpH family outer membrane protein [Verrucomicrobiota bacterium]MBS0636804.1 OmpH family outer membrane protein [Verrucomicrobiota bacterium]
MKNSVLRILGAITVGAVGTLALTSATAPATGGNAKIGIVNLKTCFEGSKLGKQEHARFEEIKKQIETTIEGKEKELNDMAPKFSDEYLDTLSPEAEAELKGKYQRLAQELSQLQNQYYNMMSQANMQIVQTIQEAVSTASKKVAESKGLDLVLNQEACFFNGSSLDVSTAVISEMDSQFKPEEVKPEAKK